MGEVFFFIETRWAVVYALVHGWLGHLPACLLSAEMRYVEIATVRSIAASATFILPCDCGARGMDRTVIVLLAMGYCSEISVYAALKARKWMLFSFVSSVALRVLAPGFTFQRPSVFVAFCARLC